MKKEEIILQITKYSTAKCPDYYLSYVKEGEWDKDKMMQTDNLVLHDLYRELRIQN